MPAFGASSLSKLSERIPSTAMQTIADHVCSQAKLMKVEHEMNRRKRWLTLLQRNAALASSWTASFCAYFEALPADSFPKRRLMQPTCMIEAYYTFRQLALAYSDRRLLSTLLEKLEAASVDQLLTYDILVSIL